MDMFNDTSRYFDEIFTIDNTEFEKHIPDIYTQTKVKQHHIFSETLFWKLQNGICG